MDSNLKIDQFSSNKRNPCNGVIHEIKKFKHGTQVAFTIFFLLMSSLSITDHTDMMYTLGMPICIYVIINILLYKITIDGKLKLIKQNDLTTFGKLKTVNTGMQTKLREQYAKELKIDVPPVLFKGVFGAPNLFERGILNDKLKAEFNVRKASMHWENPENLVQDIKSLFLFLESKYGGTPEGIVLSYSDKILKFQQSYQTDQLARLKIKSNYIDNDKEKENQYWSNVQGAAQGIINTIKVGKNLEDTLAELSLIMKKIPLNFSHSKKTEAQIKDDIQGSAKILILKKMKGNNNCLYIGKFRILTKAHYDIIKKGQRLFDNIVVALVTSKDTIETQKLRRKMLELSFPGLEIIENPSGNIGTLLKKSPFNVNAILAGSDRVRGYQDQIKGQLSYVNR
jgi:glycerol-3-phosphate cytidylyltransferase-like family protein